MRAIRNVARGAQGAFRDALDQWRVHRDHELAMLCDLGHDALRVLRKSGHRDHSDFLEMRPDSICGRLHSGIDYYSVEVAIPNGSRSPMAAGLTITVCTEQSLIF